MSNNFWNTIGIENGEMDRLWELYHENSKITRLEKTISVEELRYKTMDLIVANSYDEYPMYKLSTELSPMECGLADALRNRVTSREIEPVTLSITQLSTLLFFAYGVTRTNEDNDFPHPFRTVPSAGGLYPIEIYFHQNYVEGLDAGLYHYNPMKNEIRHILRGDQSRRVQEIFVQPELAVKSSVIVFITAQFERSAFKYGERCYRFAHIEAGHIAQNLNLAAVGMNLGTVNIGGFLDRVADNFLRLDGVSSGTLYITAIGK